MSNSEFVTLRLADDGDVIIDFDPKGTAPNVPQLNFGYPIPLSKAAWWIWVISRASILLLLILIGLGLWIRLTCMETPAAKPAPSVYVILAALACAFTLSLSLVISFNAHPGNKIWHITSVSYFLFEIVSSDQQHASIHSHIFILPFVLSSNRRALLSDRSGLDFAAFNPYRSAH